MSSVELTYGDYTEERLASALSNPSSVTSLNLSGNGLNAEQFIHIVDSYICNMPQLTTLDVKANHLGPKVGAYLLDTLRTCCPRLTYLDVNENGIQDEAMYALARLLQSSRLEQLYVVSNHITPRGVPTLCDGVASCRTLRMLSLAFNVLGDEGASAVAEALASHPALCALDLSDNAIGATGAAALAKSFVVNPHSKVEWMDLSVNRMGDDGLSAIADALTRCRNTHLYYLDVGCNTGLTETGRHAFVHAAMHFRGIRELDMTSCDLTDDDVVALIDAIESRTSSLVSLQHFNNPLVRASTLEVLELATAKKRAQVCTWAESLHRVVHGHPRAVMGALVTSVGVVVLLSCTLRRLHRSSTR